MPKQELLPADRARDSVEALLAERTGRGQPVYLLLLALVLVSLALLPLVRVPVWVQSSEIIRPAVEKHEVRAGITGITSSIGVRENQRVRAGEVIATLRLARVDTLDRLLIEQLGESRRAVRDLEALVAADRSMDCVRSASSPRPTGWSSPTSSGPRRTRISAWGMRRGRRSAPAPCTSGR